MFMEANSPEAKAFFEAKKAEIDGLYAHYGEVLSRHMFDGGVPVEPVKLTRRQRFRVVVWRVRSALAAPFAWVVKVLDPSRLAQEDY